MAALELRPTSGVVITGGASGIGLATAHAVAEVGRPVALWDLHADRAHEAADAVAAAHGVTTVGMAVDVRDTPALADAAEAAVAAIGTVGGVVHAAGVPDAVDLPDLTDKTWDPLIEVNLRAYAMVVQAFLTQLRANAPDAAVVGIASIHGIVANPANPAYAASKAGVLGLTRSMAVRFAAEGIRVNAICPGLHRHADAPRHRRPARPVLRRLAHGPPREARRDRQHRPLPPEHRRQLHHRDARGRRRRLHRHRHVT